MKPWLWLPPKFAHDSAALGIWLAGQFCPQNMSYEKNPLNWQGLKFRNRVGLAGGVDKEGTQTNSWWKLGVGFVEVGTVVPEMQSANPGPIIMRGKGSLWNRMGFPSPGAKAVANNLRLLKRPFPTPLFVNIGKNRATNNEFAVQDYQKCARELDDLADVFVVNVSSPNTTGLRNLQGERELYEILQGVRAVTQKPIMVKLSPDLSESDLKAALSAGVATKSAGFILTNTTLSREPDSQFPSQGGVSGAALAELSRNKLGQTLRYLGSSRHEYLIISAGGIMSTDEIDRRLEMGADLVQIYSALVFEGPFFIRRYLR